MNKLTVIILALVNKAIAGDLRVVSVLRPMIEKMEETHEAAARVSAELSADDKEILNAYVRRTTHV